MKTHCFAGFPVLCSRKPCKAKQKKVLLSGEWMYIWQEGIICLLRVSFNSQPTENFKSKLLKRCQRFADLWLFWFSKFRKSSIYPKGIFSCIC